MLNQIRALVDFSTLKIIFGTVLSCYGAYLGWRRYVLKAGMRIRGSYIVTSSISCQDKYVSRIILENLKDRSVTIFAIYLRIGYNLYVVIKDFGDEPLTIKGFETYQADYQPLDFYAVNNRRLSVDTLIDDRKVKKRLVLSTSDGKYIVRKYIPEWSPVHDFFRNHMTGIAHPMRSTFKGKAYGSNTAFILEFKLEDGTEQVMPIYPRDHEVYRFRKFLLTTESLESKEALESLLKLQIERGNLPVKSVTVQDVRLWRENLYESHDPTPIKAQRTTAFRYYILGWVFTRISNWKIRKENKVLSKPQKKAKNPAIKLPPN